MAIQETTPLAYQPSDSERSLDYKRKMAQLLMQQGMSGKPIEAHSQGLAQMANAALGGYMAYKADADQTSGDARGRDFMASLLMPGQGGAAPTSIAPTWQSAVDPAAPAVAPTGGSPDMPRGLRNNNPLNIEAGGFTQGQPGFQGSDGRFAKFASLDQGVGAADKLLEIYNQKHGLNTTAGIVNRWAPPSDNNPTNSYASTVAKAIGTDPNAPLDMKDPALRQKLIGAMAQFENGRPLPQTQMAQAAPTGQPPFDPMRAKIVEALRSKDPFIAKAAQGMANNLLQKQFEGEKPTDEMREYGLFQKQGGKDTFFDYKSGLKKAGATNVTVPIDQRAELAFDTAAGKHQAERFDKLVTGGMEAKGMTADLSALKDIGSRITTGKTAEVQAAIGPYAEALGIKMDGLDDLQAYRSIVAKLAPRMRVVGSGATSDYEMKQFLEALPGLGKSPGGNEMISTTLEALQTHKEAAAEIASKAMNKELTPREADKMLRELPDPLTAWKKAKGVKTLKPPASEIDDLVKKYAK